MLPGVSKMLTRTVIRISDGKLHDVNVLDDIPIDAVVFYVIDRGYLDNPLLPARGPAHETALRPDSNLNDHWVRKDLSGYIAARHSFSNGSSRICASKRSIALARTQ
jgi:hypothetical protein